jgi:hypothetical protein
MPAQPQPHLSPAAALHIYQSAGTTSAASLAAVVSSPYSRTRTCSPARGPCHAARSRRSSCAVMLSP